MKFRIGDRVILSDKIGFIIPTPSWPVWGSDYSCAGTVRGVMTEKRFKEPSATTVRVLWDNNESNIHSEENLFHADSPLPSPEPNRAFRRRKRDKNRTNIRHIIRCKWCARVRNMMRRKDRFWLDVANTLTCRCGDPPNWALVE